MKNKGKKLPPPPRKVIIEKLPTLPQKPPAIIIERWLPYPKVKRQVIYQKKEAIEAPQQKPKNLVIQWESPKVVIKQELKNLGIIKANPIEYIQKFGSSLITTKEMPQYILDIACPKDVVLAADFNYNPTHELVGQLEALKLVDLEKERLEEYLPQLQRLGITSNTDNVMRRKSRISYSTSNSGESTGSVWY